MQVNSHLERKPPIIPSIRISRFALDQGNTDLYNQGVQLYRDGKYQEAIDTFDKVLAEDPNNVNALSDKGLVLSVLAKHDEAIIL